MKRFERRALKDLSNKRALSSGASAPWKGKMSDSGGESPSIQKAPKVGIHIEDDLRPPSDAQAMTSRLQYSPKPSSRVKVSFFSDPSSGSDGEGPESAGVVSNATNKYFSTPVNTKGKAKKKLSPVMEMDMESNAVKGGDAGQACPMEVAQGCDAALGRSPPRSPLYRSYFAVECQRIATQIMGSENEGRKSPGKRKAEELDVSAIDAEPPPYDSTPFKSMLAWEVSEMISSVENSPVNDGTSLFGESLLDLERTDMQLQEFSLSDFGNKNGKGQPANDSLLEGISAFSPEKDGECCIKRQKLSPPSSKADELPCESMKASKSASGTMNTSLMEELVGFNLTSNLEYDGADASHEGIALPCVGTTQDICETPNATHKIESAPREFQMLNTTEVMGSPGTVCDLTQEIALVTKDNGRVHADLEIKAASQTSTNWTQHTLSFLGEIDEAVSNIWVLEEEPPSSVAGVESMVASLNAGDSLANITQGVVPQTVNITQEMVSSHEGCVTYIAQELVSSQEGCVTNIAQEIVSKQETFINTTQEMVSNLEGCIPNTTQEMVSNQGVCVANTTHEIVSNQDTYVPDTTQKMVSNPNVCIPNTSPELVSNKEGCVTVATQEMVSNHEGCIPNSTQNLVLHHEGCVTNTTEDMVSNHEGCVINTTQDMVSSHEGCVTVATQDMVSNHEGCIPNSTQNLVLNHEGCVTNTTKDMVSNHEGCISNSTREMVLNQEGCVINTTQDMVSSHEGCVTNTQKMGSNHEGCIYNSTQNLVSNHEGCVTNTQKMGSNHEGCISNSTQNLALTQESCVANTNVKPEPSPITAGEILSVHESSGSVNTTQANGPAPNDSANGTHNIVMTQDEGKGKETCNATVYGTSAEATADSSNPARRMEVCDGAREDVGFSQGGHVAQNHIFDIESKASSPGMPGIVLKDVSGISGVFSTMGNSAGSAMNSAEGFKDDDHFITSPKVAPTSVPTCDLNEGRNFPGSSKASRNIFGPSEDIIITNKSDTIHIRHGEDQIAVSDVTRASPRPENEVLITNKAEDLIGTHAEDQMPVSDGTHADRGTLVGTSTQSRPDDQENSGNNEGSDNHFMKEVPPSKGRFLASESFSMIQEEENVQDVSVFSVGSLSFVTSTPVPGYNNFLFQKAEPQNPTAPLGCVMAPPHKDPTVDCASAQSKLMVPRNEGHKPQNKGVQGTAPYSQTTGIPAARRALSLCQNPTGQTKEPMTSKIPPRGIPVRGSIRPPMARSGLPRPNGGNPKQNMEEKSWITAPSKLVGSGLRTLKGAAAKPRSGALQSKPPGAPTHPPSQLCTPSSRGSATQNVTTFVQDLTSDISTAPSTGIKSFLAKPGSSALQPPLNPSSRKTLLKPQSSASGRRTQFPSLMPQRKFVPVKGDGPPVRKPAKPPASQTAPTRESAFKGTARPNILTPQTQPMRAEPSGESSRHPLLVTGADTAEDFCNPETCRCCSGCSEKIRNLLREIEELKRQLGTAPPGNCG